MKEVLLNILRKFLFYIFCIQKPIENKILFMSFNGKQYSDNPRAISEKMHELYPEFELVWYIQNPIEQSDIIPDYVRVESGRWLNFLKELATSYCFVTNTQMGNGIFKRKGQKFIQTWHGDIAPKQVLYDDENIKSNIRGRLVVKDAKLTDYCIAGSDIGEKIYRSAFRYWGKVLKVGMPRNDALINNTVDINKVKKQLGIVNTNTKVLLFAPTFRDNKDFGEQESMVDLTKVLDVLNDSGNEWLCLVRCHVNIKNMKYNINDQRLINVSYYPDMTDLLSISDMLISDYSSSPGDFVITGKPVILCQFDLDDYAKNCRKFVYDFKEAGFLTTYNMEELIKVLKQYTLKDYMESDRKVCNYFRIIVNGNASEIICKIILE